MLRIRSILAAIVLISLTGCFETHTNTEQLCNKNPKLQCEKLNLHDGQCRIARTHLIWHRFDVLNNPTDHNKIIEYNYTAAYSKCLELASQIATIEQPKLTQIRFNALNHSIQAKHKLLAELKTSTEPLTLYFLWEQNQDNTARRSFLALEGSEALNTAQLQYDLATFYIKHNKPKAKQLLLNSLMLTQKGELKVKALESLASITYALNDRQSSYMWALVAQNFGVPLINDNGINTLYSLLPESKQELTHKAKVITQALKQGDFHTDLTL